MTAATLIREIEQARLQPRELLRVLDDPRRLYPAREHRDRAVIAEAEFTAREMRELLGEKFARDLWEALDIEREVRGAGGMTQTYSELYYASVATATQLATFTTEDNLQKTLPHVIIPAGFFAAANVGVGRSLRVKALGQLGTTGTPTFTFTGRLLTSTTWSAGGVGQSSAAITAGSGVTLAPWELELHIICRSVGAGGGSNTTLLMQGFVRGGTAFAATGGMYSIPGANVTLTVSIDHAVTQYFYLSAACGTSNASNLIQLTSLHVHAEN